MKNVILAIVFSFICATFCNADVTKTKTVNRTNVPVTVYRGTGGSAKVVYQNVPVRHVPRTNVVVKDTTVVKTCKCANCTCGFKAPVRTVVKDVVKVTVETGKCAVRTVLRPFRLLRCR